MTKRSRTKGIQIGGSIKAEAIAKATVERRKIITEVVPPDATRAKIARWLDLISPITEWAGLKGDRLRYKRLSLRIQQEAALESLAAEICKRIDPEEVVKPLPAKFIVPALEAVSLEEPHWPLIEW